MAEQEFKRHVAYKLRIGEILKGSPIFDADKFKFLEIADKSVARVNLIANIIDKFIQDGEKKFASVTLDDATGQIKLKLFGEDIKKFDDFTQGDTVQIVGLVRSWNNEIYLTPEIIKKRVPEYLLIRKLELDLEKPVHVDRAELNKTRDEILRIVKKEDDHGGADIEKIILELKSSPETINQEVRKLLEEGMVYEPRPGKLRYLG